MVVTKKGIIMPSAWTVPDSTQEKSVTAKTDVTARVDMSAEVAGEGLCPVCRQKMEEGYADGVPVRFCRDDLVALPLSNAELSKLDQGGEFN